MDVYYRGGSSLKPRRTEVRIDSRTGLLRSTRGVSVYNRPDHPNLAAFGGAYQLGAIPEQLDVIQIGRDPAHHEIIPAVAMTFAEYEALLDLIVLTATAGSP
jgi:hypothetical protein